MKRFQLRGTQGQPLCTMEAASLGALNKTLLRSWPGFAGTIHEVGTSISEGRTVELREGSTEHSLDEALVQAGFIRPPLELREQARGESQTRPAGTVAQATVEQQFEEAFTALGFDPDVAKEAARGRR